MSQNYSENTLTETRNKLKQKREDTTQLVLDTKELLSKPYDKTDKVKVEKIFVDKKSNQYFL